MDCIQQAAAIAASKQAVTIDGILIDMQTANAICTVAGALNEKNRATLASKPIGLAAVACWKLLGQVREATA